MNDPEEKQLSKLAKRMLATPPKRQDEMKIGKHKAKAEPEATPTAGRKQPKRSGKAD